MLKNEKYSYKISMTIEQMRLMQKISECFLRERIGQYWDLAEDLSGEGCGYVYDNTDPDNHAKFEQYIERRNASEKIFNEAYKAAHTNRIKTERVLMAEDFYEEIRHAIWLARPEPKPHGINDAYPSLNWGAPQPVPKCSVSGDNGFIEITPTQIRLMMDMAENYMRERMGQFWLLADDLAFEGAGFVMGKDMDETAFHKRIGFRDEAKMLFQTGYDTSGANRKTRNMMIAYDIYSVIRHALWIENAQPDDHLAANVVHECKDVPLIKIVRNVT